MENASKALIIAASVLLAILIIAMGVTIFNKAQNSADTSNLDQTEINMFNKKFERYADNQLGSQVKSLISFAISNANTNKADPEKLPSFKLINKDDSEEKAPGKKTASDKLENYIDALSGIRGALVSTHTYKVTLYYTGTGLIDEIEIDYDV